MSHIVTPHMLASAGSAQFVSSTPSCEHHPAGGANLLQRDPQRHIPGRFAQPPLGWSRSTEVQVGRAKLAEPRAAGEREFAVQGLAGAWLSRSLESECVHTPCPIHLPYR